MNRLTDIAETKRQIRQWERDIREHEAGREPQNPAWLEAASREVAHLRRRLTTIKNSGPFRV